MPSWFGWASDWTSCWIAMRIEMVERDIALPALHVCAEPHFMVHMHSAAALLWLFSYTHSQIISNGKVNNLSTKIHWIECEWTTRARVFGRSFAIFFYLHFTLSIHHTHTREATTNIMVCNFDDLMVVWFKVTAYKNALFTCAMQKVCSKKIFVCFHNWLRERIAFTVHSESFIDDACAPPLNHRRSVRP